MNRQIAEQASRPERQLLDGVQRALRAAPGRPAASALLALHLSRIPPPGARAHHRRVAAAILDDAAGLAAGRLFALSNGDLALLFRPPDDGRGLVATLADLFPPDLVTAWALPKDAAPALAYLDARLTDRRQPRPEPSSSAGAIAAMDTIVQTGALSDLMHRQTAVLLRPRPEGQPGPSITLAPLFREVAISTAVLEARIAVAGSLNPAHSAGADPFLFNHLATRLDHRMLAELRTDVPGGGMLSRGLGPAALHVNMTVPAILSTQFATFATACRDAIAGGLSIGVEIPFAEAFGDIRTFILARERLRLSGLRLVLDGVTHHTLAITDPARLGPTLLKLLWADAMAGPASGPDSTLGEAVARFGPARIVLHRTESEVALAWGLSHGIRRFQGRYIDAMLAAARLQACPSGRADRTGHAGHAGHAGRACTARQCRERASATGPAARAACANPALLDRAAPPLPGRIPEPARGAIQAGIPA